MKSNELEYRKIWIHQCEAAEVVRQKYGLSIALDYLIGEKFFSFVAMAEHRYEFAAELPHFVDRIHRIFTTEEIDCYLDELECSFLGSSETEENLNASDDENFDAVLGAEEVLRFARVREILQGGVSPR